MVMGNCLIGAGLIWAWWLPINKPLWTSSYSLLMAGMAANVFGCCYWLIDIKGYRRWSQPLAIYGMNAITVYVLAGLLSKLSSFIKVAGVDGSEITAGKWVYRAHLRTPGVARECLVAVRLDLCRDLVWGFLVHVPHEVVCSRVASTCWQRHGSSFCVWSIQDLATGSRPGYIRRGRRSRGNEVASKSATLMQNVMPAKAGIQSICLEPAETLKLAQHPCRPCP